MFFSPPLCYRRIDGWSELTKKKLWFLIIIVTISKNILRFSVFWYAFTNWIWVWFYPSRVGNFIILFFTKRESFYQKVVWACKTLSFLLLHVWWMKLFYLNHNIHVFLDWENELVPKSIITISIVHGASGIQVM